MRSRSFHSSTVYAYSFTTQKESFCSKGSLKVRFASVTQKHFEPPRSRLLFSFSALYCSGTGPDQFSHEVEHLDKHLSVSVPPRQLMHGPAAPGSAASPGTRNGTGREPPASPSEPAAHAHCYPRAPSCPLRPRLRVTHAPSRSARARRLAPRPLPRLRSQEAPVPSSPPHLPRRGSRERSGGSQSAPAEGGPSSPPLQPPAGRGGGEEAAAASSSVPPAP